MTEAEVLYRNDKGKRVWRPYEDRVTLNEAQFGAVICGLRMYQEALDKKELSERFGMIATDCGRIRSLQSSEVDELVERLQFGWFRIVPGPNWEGVTEYRKGGVMPKTDEQKEES